VDTLETLRDLFEHMRWADATVWRAVHACGPALADREIAEKLFHMHHVHRAFVRTWTGRDYEKFTGAIPPLSETEALGREMHAVLAAHLPSLTPESLDERFVLPWSKGMASRLGRDASPTTRGETLLQLAMHGTYHRGQVNMRLRQLGGEPPTVDYIVWLWQGRPKAEW
jgi:uncharacterized damage-inducible protein DinB